MQFSGEILNGVFQLFPRFELNGIRCFDLNFLHRSWGLRPLRALRRTFENVPNPTNVTFPSFFFSALAILSVNELSAALAADLEMPVSLAICFNQFRFRHVMLSF